MPLQSLKPQALWKHFQMICSVPHISNQEDQLIEKIASFCQQRELPLKRDNVGNVIISKPAHSAADNKKGVILQSHLDMVAQKNNDTNHNFETDPIDVTIDGDWVTAKDTTLGADNGIGVAAILAVLESTEIQHGPIEALFTINEECGMSGALGLEAGWLNGDILMNLDSEDEGELYTGCAGGIDVTATMTINCEPTPIDSVAFELKVTGLKGGHSGVDIHRGRVNANKLLVRILQNLSKSADIRINHLDGGSVRNAIPREATCTVTTLNKDKTTLLEAFNVIRQITLDEMAIIETSADILLTQRDVPEKVIQSTDAKAFLNATYACPNGVYAMSDSVPGVVATSNNIARLISDETRIQVQCLTRSLSETSRDDLCMAIKASYDLVGADVKFTGAYPGWNPSADSEIVEVLLTQYEQRFGKIPEIKVMHAGLECGILGAQYPHWDMISFGPTIRFPHSPDEKVDIATVQKFWDFLSDALEAVPTNETSN